MDFAGHFVDLCRQSSIHVELTGHTSITAKSVDHCSATLRDNAFKIIENEYRKIET